MLKKILVALVVVVVAFAAYVARRPAEFRIARSAAIDAPPEVVFAYVNDLRRWEAWSPWEKLDAEMKRAFQGPPAGEGAVYAWSGNVEVGEGRMTIVESRPNERVRIRLEFVTPFEATNAAEFTFEPVGEGTKVTWAMSGENNFVAKAMDVFVNMDRMVGDRFEQGLAALKAVAEGDR